MVSRTVLCVAPGGSQTQLISELRALAWNVVVLDEAHGLRDALAASPPLVGLLIAETIDDTYCAALTTLLQKYSTLEWVGVFGARALELAACRDLIIAYLFDHHTLPTRPEHIAATLGHAFGRAQLRQSKSPRAALPVGAESFVGESAATKALIKQIRRVAAVDATVLIGGESGSGKELTALTIHQLSSRAKQAFLALNCGAVQPQLIQSELFGYVRGAFTGATRDHTGMIEAAHGGTLFLDEISDLPLDLQCNLLRFLQERSITRVGSFRPIAVDVRVVAATNVDLEKAVAAGRFREDLFHRLNVLPIQVPPLRSRPNDIEHLAEHYFAKFALDKSPRLTGFSRSALTAMLNHPWPGNVRELINRVRRAMVMAEGRLIKPEDLGLESATSLDSRAELYDARVAAERDAILVSLQSSGNNVSQAARQLGVSRMTLYRLMSKHDIRPLS